MLGLIVSGWIEIPGVMVTVLAVVSTAEMIPCTSARFAQASISDASMVAGLYLALTRSPTCKSANLAGAPLRLMTVEGSTFRTMPRLDALRGIGKIELIVTVLAVVSTAEMKPCTSSRLAQASISVASMVMGLYFALTRSPTCKSANLAGAPLRLMTVEGSTFRTMPTLAGLKGRGKTGLIVTVLAVVSTAEMKPCA